MKSIKLLPYIFLYIFTISCGQNTAKNNESKIMKNYQYKTDKRTVYGMDLTVPGPYELYINDIAARKDYGTGMHNTFIEINPYVLKSGTYKFVLKLLPMPSELAKGGIQPSTIDFLKVAISSYEKTGTKEQGKSYEKIKIYPITKIDEPVPFYEVKGEFSINLPYELEGWGKGQDLSKIDKAELEKKVVAFYEKSRAILNNGDADTWSKLTEKRLNETYIFNYTFDDEKKAIEEENSDIIKLRNKNNMLPLSDYTLKLYCNNKLVCLERNPTKTFEGYEANINGWSPLIRKYKNAVTPSQIMLYLPQNSNDFVIIRK
ncbi:hypothetical protein [Chryseobacterium kwangjuense]|uniref:Uncharacterized protein n=1 Tax=Chryseobacterium kwangjuense TaxID=267125 RepID=A0A135WJE4_9FLAO|nr:hypothetical protein [Chryseobacterium kwangjuense]KXH85013.1 hypothetical protein AU378_04465 [Chryseobacterium kwangjuense]